VPAEGWDLVLSADTAGPAYPEPSHSPGAGSAARQQRQQPVRLGFVLQLSRFGWDDHPGGPAGWLAAVARNVAEAGLQGIALMDHLIQIPQVGRAWEPIPEPWVTLGLLAGLQPGLRLGTLVTPVTFRAPGILAKTVATLDVLSGGQAFCGIGAGWWAREHAAYGLPFPPAAGRLDQLEAAIETLRALWQPGTRAYQGTRVSRPGPAALRVRVPPPAEHEVTDRYQPGRVDQHRCRPHLLGTTDLAGRPAPEVDQHRCLEAGLDHGRHNDQPALARAETVPPAGHASSARAAT